MEQEVLDLVDKNDAATPLIRQLDGLGYLLPHLLGSLRRPLTELVIEPFGQGRGGAARCTGGPRGRMFLTVSAGVAELERNVIGERTVQALAEKRRRGETGDPPHGFALGPDGRTLVPVAREQAAIRLARRLEVAGNEVFHSARFTKRPRLRSDGRGREVRKPQLEQFCATYRVATIVAVELGEESS